MGRAALKDAGCHGKCAPPARWDAAWRLVCAVFFVGVFFQAHPGRAAFAADNPYITDVGQLNYAKFLMELRDYKAAETEFVRLIEQFPGSPLAVESQLGMADALMRSGRYKEAEEELRLFLLNYPQSPLKIDASLKLDEVTTRIAEGAKKDSAQDQEDDGDSSGEPDGASGAQDTAVAAPSGMRAVQVMLFEGKTYPEIEGELRRLRESGIDTVIVRVFHNRGDRFYKVAPSRLSSGVYFNTKEAPVVGAVLPKVIEMAHRQGLRVFAWMTTRYADYGLENRDDLACAGYDLLTGRYVRCKGLDLFNEDAVTHLDALYSSLAEYDIDGVLFQDDLVLKHNEGFSGSARALFKKDTGMTADPDKMYVHIAGTASVHYTPLFWKWAAWKNRRLMEVASRLRDTVKRKRPGAKFAINLMYESVTNPAYALAWLSQSLPAAVGAGFDYYSIMAYHRQMGEELRKDPVSVQLVIEKLVADASAAVGDPGKVLIKFQTVDWHTGTALQNGEVVDLIRDVKGIGGVSMAVVPYRENFPFRELGSYALLN